MYLLETKWALEQRRDELIKAIARAGEDYIETVRRQRELDEIMSKLLEYDWYWKYYLLLQRSFPSRREVAAMWFSFVHRYYE